MNQQMEIYKTLGISEAVYAYGETYLRQLEARFSQIDQVDRKSVV